MPERETLYMPTRKEIALDLFFFYSFTLHFFSLIRQTKLYIRHGYMESHMFV